MPPKINPSKIKDYIENGVESIRDKASPFKNVVHATPAIQIGKPSPGDHVAQPGYAYRTISQAELDNAKASGLFEANPNGKSRGGRQNVKHWDAGGGGRFYRKLSDPEGSTLNKQIVVRVPIDKFNEDVPVRFEDVERLSQDSWNKPTSVTPNAVARVTNGSDEVRTLALGKTAKSPRYSGDVFVNTSGQPEIGYAQVSDQPGVKAGYVIKANAGNVSIPDLSRWNPTKNYTTQEAAAQIDAFKRDGFGVFKGGLPAKEVRSIQRITSARAPLVGDVPVFSDPPKVGPERDFSEFSKKYRGIARQKAISSTVGENAPQTLRKITGAAIDASKILPERAQKGIEQAVIDAGGAGNLSKNIAARVGRTAVNRATAGAATLAGEALVGQAQDAGQALVNRATGTVPEEYGYWRDAMDNLRKTQQRIVGGAVGGSVVPGIGAVMGGVAGGIADLVDKGMTLGGAGVDAFKLWQDKVESAQRQSRIEAMIAARQAERRNRELNL